jgi:hypothetical protein
MTTTGGGEGEEEGEEGFWELDGGITEIIEESGSGKTQICFLPLPGRIDCGGIRPVMTAPDVPM